MCDTSLWSSVCLDQRVCLDLAYVVLQFVPRLGMMSDLHASLCE